MKNFQMFPFSEFVQNSKVNYCARLTDGQLISFVKTAFNVESDADFNVDRLSNANLIEVKISGSKKSYIFTEASAAEKHNNRIKIIFDIQRKYVRYVLKCLKENNFNAFAMSNYFHYISECLAEKANKEKSIIEKEYKNAQKTVTKLKNETTRLKAEALRTNDRNLIPKAKELKQELQKAKENECILKAKVLSFNVDERYRELYEQLLGKDSVTSPNNSLKTLK